jgi:hypothetical protein
LSSPWRDGVLLLLLRQFLRFDPARNAGKMHVCPLSVQRLQSRDRPVQRSC